MFSPDRCSYYQRRLADVTLISAGGVPSLQIAPGFTGLPFLILGTSFSDNGVSINVPTVVPFATQVSLSALMQFNDIAAFYREFQVLRVELEFQLLVGESSAGVVLTPEVITYTDPEDASPPASVPNAEAFADVGRKTLSSGYVYRKTFVPQPQILMYNSAVSSAYGYAARPRDIWYFTDGAIQMPFYGVKGLIRNFPCPLTSPLAVRVAGTVQFRCRRIR
jgi:hypothetical protein